MRVIPLCRVTSGGQILKSSQILLMSFKIESIDSSTSEKGWESPFATYGLIFIG